MVCERHIYVLKRRTFLGLVGGLFAILLVPPIWARNKVKVVVGRINQAGVALAPTIFGGQVGTWSSYGEGYA